MPVSAPGGGGGGGVVRTAVVIGVLYIKGLNPGPTIFIHNPDLIRAVFIVFFLANLILLPLGFLAIKLAKQALRVPRQYLCRSFCCFAWLAHSPSPTPPTAW
jgi:TctA family transporter